MFTGPNNSNYTHRHAYLCPTYFSINSPLKIYSRYFVFTYIFGDTQKGLDEIQQWFSLKQLMLGDPKLGSHISIFLKFKAVGKFFVIFNSVLWWHPRELMKITRAFVSCWPSKRRQQGWQWFLNLWYSIMEKEVGHRTQYAISELEAEVKHYLNSDNIMYKEELLYYYRFH